MCGICGIVSEEPMADYDFVTRMQAAMTHRGPDGAGDFFDRNIALAMRRLSIIDLEGGWQPLYNEDHSLVLICNGEIYNYLELRVELESQGHQFRSETDCETIIHLYEEHGPDCIHYLRGMFAFALWDGKKNRLLLARDRMGEKPLYLYEKGGYIIFASELKSLLRSGKIAFELDDSAINHYFHYQYVPEPLTSVKGVRKLEPGHIMLVAIAPWHVKNYCYWRMEDAPPIEDDPPERVRAELEQVSEFVIRSDVPVGVCLSGGLDSSAIAALAARKYADTMHAFSVGYRGIHSSDERADAKALADYFNMPFHEIELDTDSMVDFFPDLVFLRDDPIADISGYGYYAVSKLAREHNVPVMLQGQAGDELFWGYPWVRQAVRESMFKEKFLREGWSAAPGYLSLGLEQLNSGKGIRGIVNRVLRLCTILGGIYRARFGPSDRLIFYDISLNFKSSRNVEDVYTGEFKEQIASSSVHDVFTFDQPWPKIDILLTRLICMTYLLGNGISQGDRLSMASSVEMRLPLADYRFVETVIGLRKFRQDFDLEPKAWLKDALKDVLPEWVINRPKRGFEPPVRQWHHSLFKKYGICIREGYLVEKKILRPESAFELSKGIFPRRATVPVSFKALVLEMWCRRFSELS